MEIFSIILIALLIVCFVRINGMKNRFEVKFQTIQDDILDLKGKLRSFQKAFMETRSEKKTDTEAEVPKPAADSVDGKKLETDMGSEKESGFDLDLDIDVVQMQPPPIPNTALDTDIKGVSEIEQSSGGVRHPKQQESELVTKWKEFKGTVNWEEFTGKKMFAWLGGIAFFICAGFFVKHMIDMNYLTPSMRLAIGAFVGLFLIIGSFRPDRVRYDITRQTLAAGGVGVLYTVVFAATLYYQFIPEPAGFFLLTIVSAAAFVLAVYHRGVAISILGAAGAYITPILVNPAQDRPVMLFMLFIYLSIINIGFYRVMVYLRSTLLFLTATAGTLIPLFFGSFFEESTIPAMMIAGVWTGNLALFSGFLFFLKIKPGKDQLVSWVGNILYLSTILVSFLLLWRTGGASLLMTTAGISGAVLMTFSNREWYRRLIPYLAVSFVLAALWVWLRFNTESFSVSFLLYFIYGIIGGLGPVLLIRKYGITSSLLHWFNIFPSAVAVLTLLAFLKSSQVSVWFWPMALMIQFPGIIICLLSGAVLPLGVISLSLVISGLIWLFRIPPGAMDYGFYGFVLIGGIILCAVILFVIRMLPKIKASLQLTDRRDDLLEKQPELIQWMTALPVIGGFMLLAVSFLVQRQVSPHPGMATMVCFLILSLALCKRIVFQKLGTVSLLCAVFVQAVWIINPGNSFQVLLSASVWSGIFFIGALIFPFLFFKLQTKWREIWMVWAVFEVCQGLFLIYSVDQMIGREVSGWIPVALAFLKIPVVIILLNRLAKNVDRNVIIAFHGGVLLFYMSALPVLMLEHGWIGLIFILEATALLWLNRRVEHPGLRWVATFMAPAGLVLLLSSLQVMKDPQDFVIFNPAVLAVASGVIALYGAVRFSAYPERMLGKNDLPNYFLWLMTGLAFFLMHLVIADIFAGTHENFRIFPGSNMLHSICYAFVWVGFGSLVWKSRKASKAMHTVALALICIGTARLLFMPLLSPFVIAGMRPVFNLYLLAYFPLMAILLYLYIKEPVSEKTVTIRNLFLALFILALFLLLKVEKSTIFQPGNPFYLFKSHNINMAVASAIGWTVYGLGLYLWPKRLDRPFRIAGVILILLGLIKAAILPLFFSSEFGAMRAVFNTPTLMYGFLLAVLTGLTIWKNRSWPFDKITQRALWGTLLAVTAFYVLNVEIAGVFGKLNLPFSFLTRGEWAHQLAYSIGWLVYSFGLLVVGIRIQVVRVRWAALILILITSIKIFFMDPVKLFDMYRVGSFLGLAITLGLVSFLYQKFISSGD